MTDKMREEFAKLKRHERHCNAAESRYWCKQYRLFAERVLNEQAAQSVPVVGDVYWMRKDKLERVKSSGAMLCEVYADEQDGLVPMTLQHTTAISAAELQDLRMCKIAAREEARRVDELTAELERLRKDAERWRAALVISQAALCRPDTREPRVNSMLNAYMRAVNTGVDMTGAIDAAIAAEGRND